MEYINLIISANKNKKKISIMLVIVHNVQLTAN